MGKVELKEEPYMALFLKEVNRAPVERQQLQLPLVAACLMSKYIRLVLPVRQSASLIVDDVFNEMFKFISQTNRQVFREFIIKSRGILYAKDTTTLEEQHIIRCATCLLTTDVRIWRTALDVKLPNAFISQCENEESKITVSYQEGVEDRRLRKCLAIAFESICAGNMSFEELTWGSGAT